RRASRVWGAGLAAGMLVIAATLRLGHHEARDSAIAFAAAVAMGATAAVPFSYLWRATVGGLVGLLVFLAGLEGSGPLALLAAPGFSTLLVQVPRLLAAAAIPAALLFRCHYRAFQRGHAILAFAVVLGAPFLVHAAVVVGGGPELLVRMGAALGIVAVLS